MSQFNAPSRRVGGDIDVYTGLLCAAAAILLAGVVLLALRNTEHSEHKGQTGGFMTLVE